MDFSKIDMPQHIGIIMDGNGRWATKRGLPRSKGHLEGSKNLKKLALYAYEKGLKYLSVFAFSTENFKRDNAEVDYLMKLFVKMFNKEFKIFKDKNIKVIFSGKRDNLNDDVLKSMDKIRYETKDNNGGVFNICLNYGGHDEIIDAVKKISKEVVENKISIENIDNNLFEKYLYNDLPDIDLVIRTSGENRVSNFMLWQLAYAELYFPDVHFPGFGKKDFDKAILEYNKRDRRFGGIKK